MNNTSHSTSGARQTLPLLLGVSLGSLGVLALGTAALATTSTEPPPPAVASSCIHSIADLSHAFERVATTIEPSVVRIQSSSKAKGQPQTLPFPSPFYRLPKDPRGLPQQGLGTGVVVTEDGYILTNNHVIAHADELIVTLADDTRHRAEVIGTDPETDLAVLKVDATGLIPAGLGSSANLRVGHWVAAMGNPFGLSSTMTAGIVSAVGRSRVGLADYENFIQTDAAINPGNSGGPLVDLEGRVVGINTAIFSRSGGYMGIGFAIPIDMARDVMESLIEDGQVHRGFLGVMIQDIDAELSSKLSLEGVMGAGVKGAFVREVPADSPAALGGLQAGDIIVRFDGRDVEGVDSLRFQVAKARPGTLIELTLFRDGQHSVRSIELGELESRN